MYNSELTRFLLRISRFFVRDGRKKIPLANNPSYTVEYNVVTFRPGHEVVIECRARNSVSELKAEIVITAPRGEFDLCFAFLRHKPPVIVCAIRKIPYLPRMGSSPSVMAALRRDVRRMKSATRRMDLQTSRLLASLICVVIRSSRINLASPGRVESRATAWSREREREKGKGKNVPSGDSD